MLQAKRNFSLSLLHTGHGNLKLNEMKARVGPSGKLLRL